MKRIFIFSSIVFMAIAGCSQSSNTNNSKTSAAELTFKEKEHDFASIEQMCDATYAFEFKNTGKDPLIISNVGTSCGCTVPNWTKDPVNKNKTGIIKATYDTKRIGPFTKTLNVTSNAKNTPVTLTIKGTVKAPENK